MKSLKYIGAPVFLMASMLLAHTVFPEDQGHIFTDVQGRNVEGLFVAYNTANNTVTIQRSDGKMFEVPRDILSEEDRQFIHDQMIMNPLNITAELKGLELHIEFQDERYKPEYITCLGYKIVMETDWMSALRMYALATTCFTIRRII